ncbi:MAG: hypothetical protein ABI810_00845 [Sphingomonas bacterium]
MKNRTLKAVFAALLTQAFAVMRQSFPVIASTLPCSAFSFPCYRITAKTVSKLLIRKGNKSNKLPENREEKFSFPVLSLFRSDNRETDRHSHTRPAHTHPAL